MKICSVCDKKFNRQSVLNRHYREVHKLQVLGKKRNFKCLENQCNDSFWKRELLICHLKEAHKMKIEIRNLKFKRMDDFEKWRERIEINEKCNYVQHRGKGLLCSNTIESLFLICNRSVKIGHPVVQNTKRASKSQGSSKLNHACISCINVKRAINQTEVLVSWTKTHYGHKVELQHLRINKKDSALIAKKLSLGASVDKILDANRNNIGPDLKRLDLLTRQDVINIKKQFHISPQDDKHRNDATSIEMWVNECESNDTGNNPVLLYKKQGDEVDGFHEDDFCLMIMNKYQEEMFLTFGPNIVCIGSTHGLNNYDFELTTLLVVDEHGKGFPVALMFTNRKDTLIHEKFFSVIKSRVGNISCKTFMSDVTLIFYDAWNSVMGSATHKLLCSRHVDQAWKCNLSKIDNKEKRAWVYKIIKYLQQNLEFATENTFKKELESAVTIMLQDKDTAGFGLYFQTTYANCYREWAYLFRKDCGINTNTYIESFHKAIKYFYLDGKKVKRLDEGLHTALKYIRDKTVERTIKNTKGKRTKLSSDIQKNHRIALTSSFDMTESDDADKWILKSGDDSYCVTQVLEINCCKVQCTPCNICLHRYSCTCPDYYIKSCICRHIHYVALNNSTNNDTDDVNMDQQEDKVSEICINSVNTNTISGINKKEKLVAALNILSACAQNIVDFNDWDNLDDEVIDQMLAHSEKIASLVNIKTPTISILDIVNNDHDYF